jgi:uncharacterized membrane protein
MEQVTTIDATVSNSSASGESPIRSLAKAISWRITGSLDTILLSWIFTQQLTIAIAIGTTEIATKIVLYYLHERVWSRVDFGQAI